MKALAVRQASSIIILGSVIPTSDVVEVIFCKRKITTEKNKSQLKKIKRKNEPTQIKMCYPYLKFFLCQIDRRLLQKRAFFLFGELWLSSFFFDSTTKVTKFVLVFTLSATQRNVSSSRHATVEIIQDIGRNPDGRSFRPFEMLQKKTFLCHKNTISDTMRSQKLSELFRYSHGQKEQCHCQVVKVRKNIGKNMNLLSMGVKSKKVLVYYV